MFKLGECERITFMFGKFNEGQPTVLSSCKNSVITLPRLKNTRQRRWGLVCLCPFGCKSSHNFPIIYI